VIGDATVDDGIDKKDKYRRGPRNPRWNSGRIFDGKGYVMIRVGRGHPLAHSHDFAYEHLVVWVSAGKPRPNPWEVLHHRNRDKTDNRIENLELVSSSEHGRLHSAEQGRDGLGRFRPVRRRPIRHVPVSKQIEIPMNRKPRKGGVNVKTKVVCGQVLHHINRDKADTRIENLELLPTSEHSALHSAEQGRDRLGRFRPVRRRPNRWGNRRPTPPKR